MSAPGTPTRQDSPPADPLTVRPAARHAAYSHSSGLDDEQDSRPASPFSFKRRASGVSSPSPAFPAAAAGAAKRSLSNIFKRASSGRDSPSNKLSLPPAPAFGGGSPSADPQALLSPLGTPTRRVKGNPRTASASRGRALSPGAISPGSLRGRISDWQRTASYNANNSFAPDQRERLPGGDPRGDLDDGDEEYDDFDESRLENEPIIPKMLPELRTPEHQTPLPKLPIVVLAIW